MKIILFSLSILAFQFFNMSAFSQGSLTPPGPPAATMKTLQQIEPRIDLQNAPAAAVNTTDANYHYVINQAGSYYLSANLGVTKPSGIRITATGVTLDLNGFEISRASGTGGTGVLIDFGANNCTVSNGSLRTFSIGISSSLVNGCILRDLAVSNCTGTAISCSALMERCRIHHNSGDTGISASSGSTIINCSVYLNTCDIGIFAEVGSIILHSSVTASSTSSTGISASTGCFVSDCTASDNSGDGIHAFTGAVVRGCTASQNKGNGIVATGNGASLMDNVCYGNGLATPTASGIYVPANGCRIEGNTAYGNGFGIALNTGTSGNLVIHNHAMNNTSGGNYYSPSANNIVGTIVNSSAALNAANNSMVNVSYP